MPCYDAGPRDTGASQREVDEIKDRLDFVTQLLCKLTDTLELNNIKDPDLKCWVEDHRAADKRRKKLSKQTLNEHFKETYKGKL